MYGITMEGNSVLCHIHGFVPYFFIPAPSNMKKDDCHAFKDALNRVVLADMRSNKDMVVQVITVEPCYTEFYYLEAPRPHFGGNSGAGGKI
jgi:DNA polymerase delta subunit 1